MLEESVKALGKALLLTQNALSETKTETVFGPISLTIASII